MKKPDWYPDWSGATAVLVASGPSAQQADLGAVRGRARVITTNRSHELCPWADIAYGSDVAWWQSVDGLPRFKGLRVAGQARAAEQFEGVKHLNVLASDDRLLMNPLGTVGSGGNSGFHVINFMAQIGVKRIILVGLDVRIDLGSHWHGDHPAPLNNPREFLMKRWKKALDGAATELKRLGIEMLNTSPVSALEAYEKVGFEEAVARWCVS